MLKIDVEERRRRLGVRHGLATGAQATDVIEAADGVIALHATDPSTVYLSARARTTGMTVADLEASLYEDRTLIKHLSMRRTLWVFPRATLAEAQAGASERVAGQEQRRLIKDVEKAGLHGDGTSWLAVARDKVAEALANGREATSTELREEIPHLQGVTTYGEGKSWGGDVPVAPRVLTGLSASGRIVRASNDGSWATSRPRWTAMQSWLGTDMATMSELDGVTRLVARWLWQFGPGTEVDLKWWLGSTLTLVRRALASLDTIEVDLDGTTAHLMAEDTEPTDPVAPWGALLPGLDPTTMGWYERDWYLGEHREALFDRNGNGGPTAWWDGRIVGGWRQSATGDVELQLLEEIGTEATLELARQAADLTDWLDGYQVLPRFPSPLFKQADA